MKDGYWVKITVPNPDRIVLDEDSGDVRLEWSRSGPVISWQWPPTRRGMRGPQHRQLRRRLRRAGGTVAG